MSVAEEMGSLVEAGHLLVLQVLGRSLCAVLAALGRLLVRGKVEGNEE